MSFTLLPRLFLFVAIATTVSGCGLSGYGYGYNPYLMQQTRIWDPFTSTRLEIEASKNRPVTSGGYSGGGCNMPGAYVTCD